MGVNEILIFNSLEAQSEFSNFGNKGKVDNTAQATYTGTKVVKGAAGGVDPITMIIGAVAGAIDGAFSWGAAKKRGKANEEQQKQELYEDIFTDKKKSRLPLYIVGGVLLVGGIVTFIALKK